MSDDSKTPLTPTQHDFLRTDYAQWPDSFWKNEETGERRVTSYTTLVTAVGGGIGVLFTSKDNPPKPGDKTVLARLGRGGLVQLVATVNSTVLGGLAFALQPIALWDWNVSVVLSLVLFGGSLYLQQQMVIRADRCPEEAPHRPLHERS